MPEAKFEKTTSITGKRPESAFKRYKEFPNRRLDAQDMPLGMQNNLRKRTAKTSTILKNFSRKTVPLCPAQSQLSGAFFGS